MMESVPTAARTLVAMTLVVGLGACGTTSTPSPRTEAVQDSAGPAGTFFAAPGRLEGATEVVEVGAGMNGVIDEVLVHEGQNVSAGAVVARIECHDLGADVRVAVAETLA